MRRVCAIHRKYGGEGAVIAAAAAAAGPAEQQLLEHAQVHEEGAMFFIDDSAGDSTAAAGDCDGREQDAVAGHVVGFGADAMTAARIAAAGSRRCALRAPDWPQFGNPQAHRRAHPLAERAARKTQASGWTAIEIIRRRPLGRRGDGAHGVANRLEKTVEIGSRRLEIGHFYLAHPVDQIAHCIFFQLRRRREDELETKIVHDARWGHRVGVAAAWLARDGHFVGWTIAITEHHVSGEIAGRADAQLGHAINGGLEREPCIELSALPHVHADNLPARINRNARGNGNLLEIRRVERHVQSAHRAVADGVARERIDRDRKGRRIPG